LIHRGVGDFVSGKYALPQNPVLGPRGVGDFVHGSFAVPQTPVGMSGCGSGCNCGPCRSGMGAIDFSLTGDGIATAISPTLTMIPNWLVYIGAGGLAYYFMSGGRHRR